MSWEHTMLEGLLEARAGGERDFARAWRHAERRARAAGVLRPRDYIARGDQDEDWLPFSSFFRRACQREWEGRAHADFAGLRAVIEEAASDDVRGAEQRTVLLA